MSHAKVYDNVERVAAKQEAITRLREFLPPGATVYTILRHVSRSGMSRRISFYVLKTCEDKECHAGAHLRFLDRYVADVMGFKFPRLNQPEGLRVDGCGQDMGYAAVHNLSSVLYPDSENVGYDLKHSWL